LVDLFVGVGASNATRQASGMSEPLLRSRRHNGEDDDDSHAFDDNAEDGSMCYEQDNDILASQHEVSQSSPLSPNPRRTERDEYEHNSESENDEDLNTLQEFLEEDQGQGLAELQESAESDRRVSVQRETDTNAGIMSRIAMAPNKAGMDGIDKDKINAIILEASKVCSLIHISWFLN
jgi:hypothetical protein